MSTQNAIEAIHHEPQYQRTRLGQLLVQGEFITAEDLEFVLTEQREHGGQLGSVMIDNGLLTQSELQAVLFVQSSLREESVLNAPRGCDVDDIVALERLLRGTQELGAKQLSVIEELSAAEIDGFGDALVEKKVLSRARLRFWLRVQKKLRAATAAVLLSLSGINAAAEPAPVVELRDGQLSRQSEQAVSGFIRDQKFGLAASAQQSPVADVDEDLELMSRQAEKLREIAPVAAGYAHRFNLKPSLVMAIIHTESSFNDQAESPASALGLMQVVPFHAGIAANNLLTGSKRLPSREELLSPSENIRIGTAYLSLLETRYLSFIENEEVRRLAAIAAYNWGPTRMRAQLRRFGVPGSFEEMCAFIEKHTPTETRNYVVKVMGRSFLYEEWYSAQRSEQANRTLVAGVY